MTSFIELSERVKKFLRFDRHELTTILIAVFVTTFIFSFRDWGDTSFNLGIGLQNFLLVFIVSLISFFFRFSCQKIYGLSTGYNAKFKIWWAGLIITLVFAFLSAGRIPLILVGTMVSAFMIKQRLGEFRYGANYSENSMIGMWGLLGNLIMAILFSIGALIFPDNYFFGMGVFLNIIMAFCALIPLPQLDGLSIFFGSRTIYMMGVIFSVLATILLLGYKISLISQKVGIIIAVIIGTIGGIIYIMVMSEK